MLPSCRYSFGTPFFGEQAAAIARMEAILVVTEKEGGGDGGSGEEEVHAHGPHVPLELQSGKKSFNSTVHPTYTAAIQEMLDKETPDL